MHTSADAKQADPCRFPITDHWQQESQAVLKRMLAQLFFQESGALYMANPLRGTMELAAMWGSHESGERDLAQRVGLCLMENRIVLGDKAYIPMLPPRSGSNDQACLCVPLHSNRGLIGMLYARFTSSPLYQKTPLQESIMEQKQRFAVAAAEALAMALADSPLVLE